MNARTKRDIAVALTNGTHPKVRKAVEELLVAAISYVEAPEGQGEGEPLTKLAVCAMDFKRALDSV